jgi:hypothetical protein
MIGGSERLLSPKFLMRLQIERPNRSNPRETKTRLSNGFIVPITPTGPYPHAKLSSQRAEQK